MAIAKTVENNLLLNAWQRVMIESPETFNQIAGKGAPLNQNCDVYIQTEDREPIARALDNSIKKIARILRFWPRPKWFTDTISFAGGLPLRYQALQVNPVAKGGSWKLIEFGQRATTLLAASKIMAWSDSGYGVNDLATFLVPGLTVTNPDEIQLFFRVADGAPAAADPRYQIEPITVSISGGTATITCPRWLLVKPNKIWDVPFKKTDPNRRERYSANYEDDQDFVPSVDVYRVYNDTTTQIEVLDWNNAVLDTYDAVIAHDELGFFNFESGCWDMDWCNRPVRLRVHYRAGEPLVNGYMDSELEDAVIRLANNLMPNELCSFCDVTKNRWVEDRLVPVDSRGNPTLSKNAAENEWGKVTQGTVYAYQTALDRHIAHGGKAFQRIW